MEITANAVQTVGVNQNVLFTDTVGFINNLPHEFIEAFSSTLEESIYADLILHVVDISDPNYESHMKVTNDVLQKLKCTSPVIVVYNKCDKYEGEKDEASLYISARQNLNIDKLKNKICEILFKEI